MGLQPEAEGQGGVARGWPSLAGLCRDRERAGCRRGAHGPQLAGGAGSAMAVVSQEKEARAWEGRRARSGPEMRGRLSHSHVCLLVWMFGNHTLALVCLEHNAARTFTFP